MYQLVYLVQSCPLLEISFHSPYSHLRSAALKKQSSPYSCAITSISRSFFLRAFWIFFFSLCDFWMRFSHLSAYLSIIHPRYLLRPGPGVAALYIKNLSLFLQQLNQRRRIIHGYSNVGGSRQKYNRR